MAEILQHTGIGKIGPAWQQTQAITQSYRSDIFGRENKDKLL